MIYCYALIFLQSSKGLQDQPLRPKLAVLRLVFPLNYGEGLEDLVEVLPIELVEVAIQTVEIGPEGRPPLLVPAEGRGFPLAVQVLVGE